jgi:hypothetical protein
MCVILLPLMRTGGSQIPLKSALFRNVKLSLVEHWRKGANGLPKGAQAHPIEVVKAA